MPIIHFPTVWLYTSKIILIPVLCAANYFGNRFPKQMISVFILNVVRIFTRWAFLFPAAHLQRKSVMLFLKGPGCLMLLLRRATQNEFFVPFLFHFPSTLPCSSRLPN